MDKERLKNYAQRVKAEANGLDRSLIARVTGVTFEGRQGVLKHISNDTPVKLERDRRNRYDFYAVKVMAELKGEWVSAGFIPKEMNKLICRSLDNGNELSCSVHRRTGGMVSEHTGEKFNFGLEIRITPTGVK